MIYLDNNATTLIDPLVFEAMEPLLKEFVGNPSSIHQFGQAARGILTKATKQVASFFGVRSDEVVFTSGATEALNMLIRSVPRGRHIITTSLAHAALLEPLRFTGCSITYLEEVTLRTVEEALRPETALIALMSANNETGIKTDIASIAALAHETQTPFIVDGVASLGKEPITLYDGISAICFSGHKIHAPPGVGVAITRRSFKGHPLILGGPQQHGMRGGTENLPAIVGFAKALELIDHADMQKMRELRDCLEKGLLENLDDLHIHGIESSRVCNTSNIAFGGIDGETFLMSLDLAGVALSHGSACSSGTLEPSRVLLNMGISTEMARSSLRFSLSRFTTEEEIDRTIEIVTQEVSRLRAFLV